MAERTEQITVEGVSVTVVWSDKRRKTASLEVVDGRYIMRVPGALAPADTPELAERLLRRYTGRLRRRELNGDDALRQRADELNREYFGGKLQLLSIRYVTNQRRRYGSCTPSRGTIRISDSVAALPDWVRDYVIVHEMAHLAQPNHGPSFWRLVKRYPLAERARGYLIALGLEEGRLGDEHDEAGAPGEGIV